jgi:hypothetical protein
MPDEPKRERVVRNPETPDAFADEGYDETQPGQIEVIAGTVEHEKLLQLYPNATSYGPDHNVVFGPPTVVDAPYVQQEGATLTCTMGNWTGDPTERVYQWVLDGTTAVGDGTEVYTFAPEDVGHSAVCLLTATNEGGSSQPAVSNSVVIVEPAREVAPQWEERGADGRE